jgi:hypothetical protein
VINNNQPALVQNGNSLFYVYFDPPTGGIRYRMRYSANPNAPVNEIATGRDGDFTNDPTPELGGEFRNWTVVRQLEPGSGIQADGSVRFIVDKNALGINTGDVLYGVAVREDSANSPSGVLSADYAGGRQDYLVVGNDYCTTHAPVPLNVVSRKTHNAAGDFDVDLPLLGTPGIEPRSGGASGNYKLVFTFPNALSGVSGATVTAGNGSVSSSNIDSADAHKYIVNLTGVTSPQTIHVTLAAVNDGTTSGDLTTPMSIVVGDTNGDGTVNSADAQQTRNVSGHLTDATNFRSDVNADGVINSADATMVRRNSGQGINP